MFASFRRLIGLVLCVVLIGLCRGWFSVSSVSKDASNKVNFSISVDANQVEADAEKAKDTIEEDVVKLEKAAQNKAQANAVSSVRAAGTGQSGNRDRPYHRYSVDEIPRSTRPGSSPY
jgi:hypothetical protein